jgi:hypothetical protein
MQVQLDDKAVQQLLESLNRIDRALMIVSFLLLLLVIAAFRLRK